MLLIKSRRAARSWCWRTAAVERLELDPQKRLETGYLVIPEASDARIPAGLAACLEMGDVLRDLLDQRQMLCNRRQARVRRIDDGLCVCGAERDQRCIDLVVLRRLQMKFGIGSHLRGLKHDDHEAVTTQLDNDLLLVSAARLDADPFDATPPQPGRQATMAVSGVIHLQVDFALGQSNIKFAFAGVDPGTDRGSLAHLRRPFLGCEPLVPSTIRVR